MVQKSIKMRNIKDKKRKHSPLLKVRDALEIQTGKMSIKEMVIKMSKHIDSKVKRNRKLSTFRSDYSWVTESLIAEDGWK